MIDTILTQEEVTRIVEQYKALIEARKNPGIQNMVALQIEEETDRIREKHLADGDEVSEEEIQNEVEKLPLECLASQRHAIETFEDRTRMILSIYDFPNQNDYDTQFKVISSGMIAAAMCNVKGLHGKSLGNSVDEIAQNCVNAQEGSEKQAKLITELQTELDDVKAYFAKGGPGQKGKEK